MPDYKYKAPNGRVFTLRGDSPATEQELEQVYASLPPEDLRTGSGITPEELRTQTRADVGIYPEEKVSSQERFISNVSPILSIIPGVGPLIQEAIRRSSPGINDYRQAQGEALIRGALRTVTGGLSDPALERVSAEVNPLTGGIEEKGPFVSRQEAGPERFAPILTSVGEIGGAALPAGELGLGVKTALQSLIRSGTTGGLFGAAGGLTEELQRPRAEGESISLSDALNSMIVPATIGTGLGLAIPGAAAVGAKLARRVPQVVRAVPETFDVTIQNSAMDLFRPKGEALTGQIVEGTQSGVFQDSLRNIRSRGKPSNVEDVIQFGADASDDLIKRHNAFVKQNKGVITDNSDVGQEILSSIEGRRLISPEARKAVTDLANEVSGEGNLSKDFDLLRELNEKRASYYRKTEAGQSTDLDDVLNAAEQIARDRLSSKLDSQYQLLTNTTDNPYRQYGALRGLLDPLRVRLNDLLKQRGIQKSQGLSLDRELLSTLKNNKSLFSGGEKARIDNVVVKIFDTLDQVPQPTRIQRLPPVIPLTEEEAFTQRMQEAVDASQAGSF